ncbi:MAG: glycosyltransferase family 39 protein [Spirochaetota bacterium]|nr:glycosyltransferase family 39 protein [Spirochaetota bacterium]
MFVLKPRLWAAYLMLLKYRFPLVCAVFALLLFSALALLEWTATRDDPQIRTSFLLREDGSRRAISLPFSEKSPEPQAVYRYSVALEWHKGANTRFRIIPDDYLAGIAVNGNPLPEKRYSGPGRSDYKNGLIVDFGGSLRDGMNEIIFTVNDTGGAYGMDMQSLGIMESSLRIAVFVLCILLVLTLAYLVLHRFKADNILIILILVALAWQLISLGVREHKTYSYDLYEGGNGHINYIQYIANKGSLPPPNGWSYYHPPLYYITGAGVWLLAKALQIADPFKALQLLSLIYYCVFLVYSLRLLAQVIRQPWMYRLAAALLLFWPAGFLCASRIGNDALLYPLFMMTLFYAHKWYVGEKGRDLLLASICCGLGFFVKISIFPLGVILGCLVLWRLFRKHITLSLRYAIAIILILAGSFFFSALNKWVYGLEKHNTKWLTAPFNNLTFIRVDPRLYTKDRVVNYIIPDTRAWFESPYISSRDDTTGRANFWNYMGKSSMYGEFSFHEAYREKRLAPIMNICYVFLIILVCYGIPLFWRRRRIPYTPIWTNLAANIDLGSNESRGYVRRIGRYLGRARADAKQTDLRFVLTVSVFLLILCIFTRINTATPMTSDFRYLMPVMPMIVLAAAYGLERLREYRWRFILANAVILCFALASLIFYFGI